MNNSQTKQVNYLKKLFADGKTSLECNGGHDLNNWQLLVREALKSICGDTNEYLSAFTSPGVGIGSWSDIQRNYKENCRSRFEKNLELLAQIIESIEMDSGLLLQKQEPQPTPPITYNFINSSNIIAGNQTEATINITLKKIAEEIDTCGGIDKDELREMVHEILQAFEENKTINKSSFAKFSETLEKHSWITGSLVQLLGSAVLQFIIPHP